MAFSPRCDHLSAVLAFGSMLLTNCRCFQVGVLPTSLFHVKSVWCSMLDSMSRSILQCPRSSYVQCLIVGVFAINVRVGTLHIESVECSILCRCCTQFSFRYHCVQLQSPCRCVLFTSMYAFNELLYVSIRCHHFESIIVLSELEINMVVECMSYKCDRLVCGSAVLRYWCVFYDLRVVIAETNVG